jgi:hypothetical protein
MSHDLSTLRRPTLFAAALALACAGPGRAAVVPEATRDFLDISPERVAAFRATMREFVGGDADPVETSDGVLLRSAYSAPPPSTFFSDPYDEIASAPGIYGRDLVFEEEFLIQGREDEFRNASRRWIEREVKGSDAAARRRMASGNKFRLKGGWDHGPVAGFGYGPMSVTASDHEWRLKGRWDVGSHGWIATAWLGEERGDEAVGFTFGRTLSRAIASR